MASSTTTVPPTNPVAPLDATTGRDGIALSSAGNAERFLRRHRKDVRWIQGTSQLGSGTFYIWNGSRWSVAETNKLLLWMRQSITAVREWLSTTTPGTRTFTDYVKFFRSSDSKHGLYDSLALAGPAVRISQSDFDADPLLLSVQNGVLDLRTGEFRQAKREDMLTKVANVAFDAQADCPLWKQFIIDCTKGDADFARYLQQLAGLTLSGEANQRGFYIVWGPKGSGKSVFGETLFQLLGEGQYAQQISPESLAATKHVQAGRARPDLAKLQGARMAFANEGQAGLYLDAGLVKSLTGNDTIPARFLFQNEFSYVPQFKLWLRTNYKPFFDGSDEALNQRIKLLPFENQIPPEKQDLNLQKRLRAEFAGILNWMLTGWLDYQKHGLIVPDVVRKHTEEYVESQDVLLQFFAEETVEGAEFNACKQALYLAYKAWCEDRGERPFSSKRFRDTLRMKGKVEGRDKHCEFWAGFKIKGRFTGDPTKFD